MNNIDIINNFLRLMSGAASEGYQIDEMTVYINLVRLNINDKYADISSNFPSWIKRFESNQNINVFVDPDWNYFCQFVSSDYDRNKTRCEIKLYIPIDKEHIYEGANQIFDFLSREKISHLSKIGKHIRFDDIVIRVTNSEDANKIINFVNNNSYLRQGSLPLNPFASREGIVSVTWDGDLSYNSVVSNWISEYINWEKNNNNLSRVNYRRFYYFVSDKCSSLFQQGVGLKEYFEKISEQGIFSASSFCDPSFKLLNYYNVTQLFLSFLNLNLKKEDVYGYVDKILDSNYQKYNLCKINRLYHGVNVSYNDSNFNKQRYALKQSFIFMCQKYGYNGSRNAFLQFMKDGNYNRITRYNHARELLKNNAITNEMLPRIANEWLVKNINIEGVMANAFQDTYGKYGYYQVVSAIKKLLMERNFSQITNNNGHRLQLINELDNEELLLHVMEILTRNGYKIEYNSIESLCDLYISIFDKNISRKPANL